MFGSGFGASSSPFGATSPSPFGQPAASPFGAPAASSPFGATTTTGVFGQQPAQSAFGASPAPAFGASAPAFGVTSAPAFGQTQSAFGSTAFGAKPAGFGFGTAPASPFGAPAAPAAPAFGAAPASAPAFGSTLSAGSPFGAPASTPAFGAPASTPAFGAPASTPAFGAAPAAPLAGFGSTTFGAAPAAGGFGAGSSFGATARGTRGVAYRKTQETDTASAGVKTTVYYNSISCMPEYASKSAEELRWEDYQDGCKGNTGAAGAPAGGTVFGAAPAAPAPAAASPFGSPSPFGAVGTSSPGGFGAAAPAFGAAPASTPAFGFGASTPAFGAASSSPAFGAPAAPAASPFGAPASGSPFGANTTSTGFGTTFGASSSTPAFGAPASTPAFGATGFGATSAPAFGTFGATSAPAFGAASAPAFGATSQPAFGFGAASSTPAFGAASSSGFSFAAPAPAFGASPASSASPFGATSAPSLFGGASAPALGSTPGTSLFGAKPAASPFGGGGSLFGGAASTPAFGATSTPAFGAAPASGGGGGLFGSTPASTPGFGVGGAAGGGGLFGGGGGGGLFGGGSSFMAASQPAGALVPAQPVQAPTVGGSPYGVLPEPPKATPLPENKVGLTQQARGAGAGVGGLAGGTPRPMALISPRSITPRSGVRMRPRRSLSAAASRLGGKGAGAGAGGADFLALAPAGGGEAGADGRAGSATPNGNVFVPRDNPRRLFIRDPLPSTAAAGAVSPSPSLRGGGGTPGRPGSAVGGAAGAGTPGPSTLRLTPSGAGGRAADGTGGGSDYYDLNGGGDFGEAELAGQRYGERYRENGTAGGRGEGAGPDDAELQRLLPKLTRAGYYTEPSLQQLAAMAREDPSSLRRVPHFSVGARSVGSVRFLEPTDVRGLDLDRIVTLAKGSIEVYLDDDNKPDVGKGLNKPAVVTMERIFKVDKETGRPTTDAEAIDRFTRKLKKVTAEQGAAFVSYDPQEGVWRFQVEHFSRYGLLDSDDEDEEEGGSDDGELHGYGVRRLAGGGAAAAPQGRRAARAARGASAEEGPEMEMLGGEEYVEVEAPWDEEVELAAGRQESEGQRSASLMGELMHAEHAEHDMLSGEEVAGAGGAARHAGRALPVALPAQLGMDPEDLQRIRDNLFAPAARAPFFGLAPPGQEQRVIHVDLSQQQAQQQPEAAAAVQPAAVGAFGAAGAAAAAAAKAAPRRASWRQRAHLSLRPPAPTAPAAAAAGGKAAPSPPFLPSGPSPVSPAPLQRTAPICPVPAPKPSAAHSERCLPDAGLFAGASFRGGWGPSAQLAAAGGRPSSAAHVMLSRVAQAPPAGASQDPARLRARLEAMLRLHMAHSMADAGPEDGSMAAGAGEHALHAPRWRLRCGRGADLRQLTLDYIALCNEQAQQAEGLERTLLRHQATTWELVHVLFGEIQGEEGPLASAKHREGEDEDAMDGEVLYRLAAFKRRAGISRWLRDRARPAVERALGQGAGGEAAGRVLSLLSGHQLAGATALAAATGNVRLATLLAQAGTKSVARAELAAQLAVWREAGIEQYIAPAMQHIYSLLAGDVDSVTPHLPGLDWRRAMGMQLWYGTAPGAGVAEALEAYSAAVAGGSAPAPLPLYAEQGGLPPLGGSLDVSFELLRLYAVVAELEGEEEAKAAAMPQLLAQLLRPGGHTPDPLDYAFSWLLLSLLTAIGAIPAEAAYPQVFAAHMSFISQLECAGALAPWAVYAALHLPEAPAGSPWEGLRDKVVRELLARHCPEWGADEEAAEFFGATLGVPGAWLAEAQAQWAQYERDDAGRLRFLLEAGEWGAAHAVLCSQVAPRWFLGGPGGLQLLEEALLSLEPHAAEVDAAGGPGAWASGGGLYAAFLYLQGLYAQLLRGAPCDLSFDERQSACRRLAELLEDAALRWGLAGSGTAGSTAGSAAGAGGNSHRAPSTPLGSASAAMDGVVGSGNGGARGRGVAAAPGALQQAAFAAMSEALAGWVVGDRAGPAQLVPSPAQALLGAGLPTLRTAAAASGLQLAATYLAQGVA